MGISYKQYSALNLLIFIKIHIHLLSLLPYYPILKERSWNQLFMFFLKAGLMSFSRVVFLLEEPHENTTQNPGSKDIFFLSYINICLWWVKVLYSQC